mmetsp:Transcript_2496/g.5866  ORF Transcript_2496/g.5866 Transcript_2496/m.5866 type:complete len:167 (+) Transcript_2496:2-502(+)
MGMGCSEAGLRHSGVQGVKRTSFASGQGKRRCRRGARSVTRASEAQRNEENYLQMALLGSSTVPAFLIAGAARAAEEASDGLQAVAPEVVEKAVEAAPAAEEAGGGGFTLAGGVLIFSPIILYGFWTLYRAVIGSDAKLVDFITLVASFVVIGNLISILVFKTRWF